MLHAKVMTVDGTSPTSARPTSTRGRCTWDEEINVVAIDDALVGLLDSHFESDLERSVRIEPGRWQQRALWQRAAERAIAPVKRYF